MLKSLPTLNITLKNKLTRYRRMAENDFNRLKIFSIKYYSRNPALKITKNDIEIYKDIDFLLDELSEYSEDIEEFIDLLYEYDHISQEHFKKINELFEDFIKTHDEVLHLIRDYIS